MIIIKTKERFMSIHLTLISLSSLQENGVLNLENINTDMAIEGYLIHREHVLAQTLLSSPNIVLIQEDLSETLVLKDEQAKLAEQAKSTFPDMSALLNLNELSTRQQIFLLEHGAANTLLLLGKIPAIYPLASGDIKKLYEQASELVGFHFRDAHVVVLHKGLNSKINLDAMGGFQSVHMLDSLGQEESYLPGSGHYGAKTAFYQGLRHQQLPSSSPSLSGLNETMFIQAGIVGIILLLICALWQRNRKAAQPHHQELEPQ
jgi:hypothetical protein